MRFAIPSFVTLGLLSILTAAIAAEPGPGCEASKLATTSKYAQCRLKADAKAAKTGDPVDYSKCSLAKFSDAETKAGGMCPTTGDQASIGNFIDACTVSVRVGLDTGELPLDVLTCDEDLTTCSDELSTCQDAACANGTAEYGETCDGADLHGKSCATEAPSTPYGPLVCNGTCDGFVTSGCRPRFVDNGDGTVTDNATHLMWEKKTTEVGSGADSSNPHDVDNYYTWTAGSTAPDGTAFTEFLWRLNGASDGFCYLGHCDWRLPTIEELDGIVDAQAPACGYGSPCIDAVFGPTQNDFYWSASTIDDPPLYVLIEIFNLGMRYINPKTYFNYGRAVRSAF